MKNPIAAAAPTHTGRAALLVICAAVIGFYFWRCHATVSELGRDAGAEAYYNLLVAGFEAGQLDLKVDVPEGLKQLPDPYDPAANLPYRKDRFVPLGLHDTSFFRGKLHLYFGVTPALVLFWPFHLVTGHFLTHASAVAVFCSLGFLAGTWLLRDMARRYFPALQPLALPAAVIGFGFGSSVSVMMWRADVWEVPIACAYALIMIALGAIWRALHAPAQSVRWVAAASLAYALAIGARPSALPGAVILLIPILAAWRQHEAGHRLALAGRLLLALVVPLAVVGSGLALYNQLRFGDPFEFGQRYQLAGDRQDNVRHFSAAYLWYNFHLYFLSIAGWRDIFPFVRDVAVPPLPPGHGDVDMPHGILTNTPFTLFAAAAVLLWRRPNGFPPELRWLAGGLAWLFGVNAVLLCFFYGTCTRYQVEFHPYLVLMAGVGLFVLAGTAGTTARRRFAAMAVAAGLTAYSAVFGGLKSFQGLGENFHARAVALVNQGDEKGALGLFERAIHFSPGRLDPRFYAGMICERLGRIPEAIAHLEGLVRIAPHHAIAQNNLSQLLRQAGRHGEAIEHFRQALQFRPDFFEAWFNLGMTLQGMNRQAEAVDAFRRAAQLRPEFAEAHYSLAVSLRALGRVDEARQAQAEARRLKPALPELEF